MRRCLIIGADSRIGGSLMAALRERGNSVDGTTRRLPAGEGLMPLDLRSPSYLPNVDVAYFCAAITGFRACSLDPETARQVNVLGPAEVAARIVFGGGKVVLLSSSAAETSPGTVYGGLKLEAENLFRACGERSAVFRFGPVKREDRMTYPDGPYQPIELASVVSALADVCDRWVPGLHRLLGPVAA